MIPAEPFESRLISARRLTPAVRELVLERADGRPFAFEPGQWVNLVLPLPGGDIKRAYSIASPPVLGGGAPPATGVQTTNRFEIAVTRVTGGPGSEYLHALPEGATLRAIGPHGLFTRRPDDGIPSIFVGTGTGVAPLRSMLRAALAAGAREPLWLLFGARHEEDVLYADELRALAKERSNVRHEITLSRPGPGWNGRRGYVQAHLAELFAELREAAGGVPPHAYVCGLDRMVSSVKTHLRSDLGLDRRHVHTERYD